MITVALLSILFSAVSPSESSDQLAQDAAVIGTVVLSVLPNDGATVLRLRTSAPVTLLTSYEDKRGGLLLSGESNGRPGFPCERRVMEPVQKEKQRR
jgi:hypothetical protein